MKLKKNRVISVFKDIFGFESGIDISDDCVVLYRRNIVIKNIIFLSNIVYTIILTILSFGEASNWGLTIVCFPLTFLINGTLKKTINSDPRDYLKQQIAMYIACFYMFLSAILLYLKLKLGAGGEILGEAGYILIYYSLVVVSLYQDKKMLKTVFKFVLVIITLIHFTLTYNFVSSDQNSDILTFFRLLISFEGKDILLRTIILLTFMIVMYQIASLGQYMQEERKKELIKRQQVQEDFTDVVMQMFNVSLEDQFVDEEKKKNANLVSKMSFKLANLLGYSDELSIEIKDYANIQYVQKVDLDITKILDKDEQFEKLRIQTTLGNIIIKRLQLERKCNDIVRTHIEGAVTDDFTDKMIQLQSGKESQIILLCDIYVTLRGVNSYKRPYPHKTAIEHLENEFKVYFDSLIFDRFIRFCDDFKEMYDED